MKKDRLKERKITINVIEKEIHYNNIIDVFTKKYIEKMKKHRDV